MATTRDKAPKAGTTPGQVSGPKRLPPSQDTFNFGHSDLPLFQGERTSAGALSITECLTIEPGLVGIAFSPDASMIAYGEFDQTDRERLRIRRTDGQGEAEEYAYSMPGDVLSEGICAVAWHPYERCLFTGSWRHEGGVRAWSLRPSAREGKGARTLYRHTNENVSGLALSPGGGILYSTSVCNDKSIRRYSLGDAWTSIFQFEAAGRLEETWNGESKLEGLYGFSQPGPSADGNHLAVRRSMNDSPNHVDVRKAQDLSNLVATLQSRSGVYDWIGSGPGILTEDSGGRLVAWDFQTGEVTPVMSDPLDGKLQFVLCSQDGRHALAEVARGNPESQEVTVYLLEMGKGLSMASMLETSLPARAFAGRWVPGGGSVLLALANGQVVRIDRPTAR